MLRKVVVKLLYFFNLGYIPALKGDRGMFVEEGWLKSYKLKQPVNKQNEPIPWYTYSSIHFLEQRLNKELRVFEYGCGNSTLWLSKRVKEVISVEHDRDWYERIKKTTPLNVSLTQRNLGDGYVEEITEHGHFDIVVIDGRDRNECAKVCINHLSESGIIIFDNSDREGYSTGFEVLRANGFKEIGFEGFGPINTYNWKTSIFYRDKNCIGL